MSTSGHHHGASALHASDRHIRPLLISLGLTIAILIVQIVTGLVTGSLALLSEAGHIATDVLAMAMPLAAIQAAKNARNHSERTFGLYRLEILAALANAMLLFGVAGYIVFEAINRLQDSRGVASTPVLVVGVISLVLNVIAFKLLHSGSKESLNVRGAYLEVMSNLLGSAGVIVAAIIWGITGWTWVDPIIGAAIGIFILPRAYNLGRTAIRVLLQSAPEHLDVATIQTDLANIAGVIDVHAIHVWTLAAEMDVASGHLMVAAGVDTHAVLNQARVLLAERHGITHATLQIEPDNHQGCNELNWWTKTP